MSSAPGTLHRLLHPASFQLAAWSQHTPSRCLHSRRLGPPVRRQLRCDTQLPPPGAAAPAASSSAASSMEADVDAFVRRIHASPSKAVVYATGGASQALSWLLGVPGASHTVLEVNVPYCRDSMVALLGEEPQQYCSEPTAIALATAAYRRAANLTRFGEHFVGIGATCTLASEQPKKGEHRALVAAHGQHGTRVYSLRLAKGARSRWQEDGVVSRLLLMALAEADAQLQQLHLDLGLLTPPPANQPCTNSTLTIGAHGATAAAIYNHQRPSQQQQQQQQPLPTAHQHQQQQQQQQQVRPQEQQQPPQRQQQNEQWDELHCSSAPAPEPLQALLDDTIQSAEFSGGGAVLDAPRAGRVYLPGSFNPLHDGHKQLLAAAVEAAGPHAEGCYELSVGNADKGLLPLEVLQARVQQFTEAGLSLLVTRQPLFTGKARLLPRSTFVMGYDTAVRLVMPKYYGNDFTQMLLEFAQLRHLGCSFLVAGRRDGETGKFLTLADANVPEQLQDLFAEIPESAFRMDVSSTEIRARRTQSEAGMAL